MFTIPIYWRFALIAICLIGGTILAIFTNFWYALPILLAGIILLVGYFLFGTLNSAAVIMQEGDIEGAKKRLQLTYKPEWLFGPNKAMFYMIKGTIALQERKMDEGEEWFKKAEKIDMPSDNEAALIQIQLAGVNVSRRKWNQARSHIKKAKALTITNPQIKDQLKQVEEMVKTKGMSHAKQVRQKRGRGPQYF